MKSLIKGVHLAQRGMIDVGGVIMMGIAFIFLAVGFIVYPIVITGTDAILAYQYSANASITDATYTGLTSVVGVTPLIILLGFVTASIVTGFLGMRVTRGGGSSSISPSSLMLMAIGIIFLAVALIIFPVLLDGVSSVIHGDGQGVSSTYTGLATVLAVVPLIALVGFLAGGVVAGFFGIKGSYRGG